MASGPLSTIHAALSRIIWAVQNTGHRDAPARPLACKPLGASGTGAIFYAAREIVNWIFSMTTRRLSAFAALAVSPWLLSLQANIGREQVNTPFDETSLGREFDLFATELTKLPTSPEITALELRFALLREAVAIRLAGPNRVTVELPSSLFDA